MLLLKNCIIVIRAFRPNGQEKAYKRIQVGNVRLLRSDVFQLLWEAIILYVCIRAINTLKEAYRLSQLHLQELDEVHRALQQMHEALQEASVHFMRYAALAERTRLARDMHDGLGHQLASEVSVALYRILQEALTNIMRHAEATAACIQIQEHNQQVILTVSDNGCYTEKTELSPSFDIKGIMERSQSLGGSCTFAQNQPHGLRVQVTLPSTLAVQDDVVLKQTSPDNGRAAPSIAFSDWRAPHG